VFKRRIVFLGIFLAMALALCVSAAGATDAPAAAQPTVKLWAFYDKDVSAYPTGWTYLDPVITDPSAWQQDSDWLPFPSPHYALYGGTWGSDTMGALIQEGDFGPGVAEIPLADGLYWVVLSAPPGNWQLTTDSVQKVYVWNGNVYVQWANEGLWYGDKVLVGIVDGAGCALTVTPDNPTPCAGNDTVWFYASGLTPNGQLRVEWSVLLGQIGGSTYLWTNTYFNNAGPDGTWSDSWGWIGYDPGYTSTGTWTFTDMTTGCSVTLHIPLLVCG